MNEPRCYTREEVQTLFLRHCGSLVGYWLNESKAKSAKEKMEGLMHSVLSAIDGCNCALTGFDLTTQPHPDDEEYMRSGGKNWFPTGCNISGELHERWFKVLYGREES